MPFSDKDCPHCGLGIHSDDLWEGKHLSGCGEQIPEEIYEDLNDGS